MKRFLLSSVLLLTMGRMAFAYLNTGTVQVPPMDPQLVAIDDPNFINRGTFDIDLSQQQNISGGTLLYTTSDTLNYTNSGVMIGIPGFDLENFPASVGQAQMAANFVNANSSPFGGGVIGITNIYGGTDLFSFGGVFGGLIFPVNFDIPGLAMFKVRATNIVDSGLIAMDNTGLIDLRGGDLNLDRGQFVMTGTSNLFTTILGTFGIGFGSFGVSSLDFGMGSFGTNTFGGWFPFADLTPTTALSPLFLSSANFFEEEMSLTNATPYVQTTAIGTNGLVWDIVYLQDFSASNIVKNVYFNDLLGEFVIEWAGPSRDPITGQTTTNYFYLTDDPLLRRNTNTFFVNFPGVPSDFEFFNSPTKFTTTPPALPGYVNPAPPFTVTNDFSYASVRPNAVLVDTNTVVSGSPTNLPGRIQLRASHSMSLANTRILGPNYLRLDSPFQFNGNSNAVIEAPYSDVYLGVTNGSLTLSNLLVPQLPDWTGVPGAPSAVFQFGFSFAPTPMGGIQAWSGSYIFTDANGVTNDVRVLLVNSALQPTTPALQQDLILHATNDLTVSQEFDVFRHFSSDARILALTTNDNSAFSLEGQLNLLSADIFWSASLPNLQYLTNWGRISTMNLANFAGNMLSPNSDPANATPYQAFVNHGTIANQGTLIRANYFENNGTIEENFANGIDIGVNGTAWATNGSFIAPGGEVAIAASSLLASNGLIVAGQDLTLNITPCYLSDGYAFENQFGHITNSVLPNVVTNGNTWSVGGGVRILVKPPTGDLLGTTITNIAAGGRESINFWPGEDRGISPGGFATNLALGRMILNADANPSQFTFRNFGGSNALYVDSIELQGNTTNTDAHGNPQSIAIDPGMTIYYAQAIEDGVSIAEKLNGKYGAASAGPFFTNGGQFFWVSNYAGVYSSTNIPYPDGNTYIFNEALAISPDIDSDGDGPVNVDDATPISIGTTFDIFNIGPQPCDGSVTNPPPDTNNPVGPTGTQPGRLVFPNQSSAALSNSSPISFALAQGSYNGLFYDTNGVNPASSGFFTAKVTSKGGLTAKLQLGSHTYSFSKPPFDTSGHFSGQVTGKGLATLTVDLQLVNNDEITGTVSGNGWTAKLLAERAAFSSKNKAPWAGNDTLLLSTKTNSTAAAGDSFASVTITSSGAIQWSGMLPDGSKISQKSTLSKDGVWPLYAAPYGGAGVFIGWMQCTNNPAITGSGVWVAPAGANGLYSSGLTNDLDATGSSVTGFVNPTVKAILSGPSLDTTLTNRVTISGKIGQSSNALKLSINTKTGVFSGSMVDPNSSKVLSLQGAFLEGSGTSGGGFFLSADKTQGGKISLAPVN